MKHHLHTLARLRQNDQGSYTIMAALATTLMVGVVGYGVDTYRLENARTELDHVVGLTCDRIENADYALYPSTKSRIDMATKFANSQLPETALNPEHTSLKVSKNGDKINVAGETEINATLMAAVGFKTMAGKSSRDCSPPSNKPPEKACTKDDLIYLNPGNFELESGTLVAGQKNYTATLYDPNGNIKARQVVGNGSGVTEVFLKSSSPTDLVVVQPFNADGTTPAACNPTIECKGDRKTCPEPPTDKVCTMEKVLDFANTMTVGYGPVPSGWTDDPGVKPYLSSNKINYQGFEVSTSKNYKPEVLFEYHAKDIYPSTTLGYMYFLQNGLYQQADFRNRGAKLYRVIGISTAAWELEGQCVNALSPIVLDLVGKGKIETSGLSSARYVIPQHRVKATVDFDMGGTGKTVRTEWITGNGQALLVDNRDGKAATAMKGTRLFGNVGGFAHGYEKLATLDLNKDGKVSDMELQGLAAWIDNGDAKVQDGELKTLADIGITELSTSMSPVPTGDGGTFMRSTAVMNGKTIMTEDAWFGVDLSKASASPQVSQIEEQ